MTPVVLGATLRRRLRERAPLTLCRRLMFSEDYAHQCDHHNDCHYKHSVDWDFETKEGDPPIPHSMKHPPKKCRSNEHEIGNPEKDFQNGRKRREAGSDSESEDE
ncbi:hypothetical protein CC80DRAFT_64729 [Byssothecium circinans]|uniref:Uncharacterized protein n=1 Tax=Byssothecium circinans TaxID=147558 RepID=A0A6A5TVU7_9PLEO|nr:hypothetical protein CC80DRAFT_64729 [Byssothecium circinans]